MLAPSWWRVFSFASQNLSRLRRTLAPLVLDILTLRARGLFLTDCVKPSLWQRLTKNTKPMHEWGSLAYKHWYAPTATHLTLYFHPLHQPKTPVFTKNCHPKSYFFHTLSRILEIFHSKTPIRLEFEKKVPKCPLFLRLLSLKDPLFFALHTHDLFEGNVAPSNTVRSWKILYSRNQNGAIWWILSGANLIKVMKIKFQFYRLNWPNCALWMNFIGGQGWHTGYYHPSIKHGRGYILQPPSINLHTWVSKQMPSVPEDVRGEAF